MASPRAWRVAPALGLLCVGLSVALIPALRAGEASPEEGVLAAFRLRATLGEALLLLPEDVTAALGGRPAQRLVSEGGGRLQAVSARVMAAPVGLLWRVIVDEDHHLGLFGGVVHSAVLEEARGAGGAPNRLIYKRLTLPIPLTESRHWVVGARHQGALWEKSGGRAWQVRYGRVEDAAARIAAGVAQGRLPGSIEGEATTSGVLVVDCESRWTLYPVDEGRTLVEYQAVSTLGPGIPEGMVRGIVSRAHEGVLKDVEAYLKEVAVGHHRGVHIPLYDPAGARMSAFESP